MSTKRVLIVEDDAHIADLLRMHLGDEGYDVAHAASGDAGLRLLEQDGPWDALVLDVMLPGVDGLQVCRARDGAVCRSSSSARGSETQRIVGLELGADDYLANPFDAGTGGTGARRCAAPRRWRRARASMPARSSWAGCSSIRSRAPPRWMATRWN
jgi:CheY-like chemotaxis protein